MTCVYEEDVDWEVRPFSLAPFSKLRRKQHVILANEMPGLQVRSTMAIMDVNTDQIGATQPGRSFKHKGALAAPDAQFDNQLWLKGDGFDEDDNQMVADIGSDQAPGCDFVQFGEPR